MGIQSQFDGQFTTDWDGMLAERTERMQSSVIRELLKLTMLPDIISFAGGLPAPAAFPVRDFRDACSWVLAHDAEKALQYGPTEGYPPLKEYLIAAMAKYEIPAVLDNVLFTSGSQQALDFVGRVFLNEGDKIITGEPTYLGAIQAWDVYGPQYLTVPLDDQGMRMDRLEEVLEANSGVKFIYVLPNFHNPAGTTLPEDITPIFALHKENTIYLSTFSKTLAPGLRLGWIVAPERIMKRLVQAKQGADLHTSTLVQYLAHDICQRGLLRAHVRKLKWTRPLGGLFLWVRMPESLDAQELLTVAVEEKVAFVPGHAFYPGGNGGHNCMRLNFSYSPPDVIEEGIARLGRAIKRMME